jgi:hypothetical protein
MRSGGLVAWLGAASLTVAGFVAAAGAAVARGPDRVIPLGIEADGITRLAASPNGQTVYAVDESRRSVVAIDPSADGRRRDVVAAVADEGTFRPVALAALPGDIVAVISHVGDEWSLMTYRLRPGEPVDAGRPLQELSLGRGAGPAAAAMAVSRSRGWCVVAGLPAPLPPVIRLAFAGPGVRRRPDDPQAPDASGRPVAVAIGPADELVTIEPAAATGGATLVFTGPSGRELLRLDTGLADVRGVAFTRDGSALWAIAGDVPGRKAQPAGLWRLDAVFREGRQAVRPTCVVPLADPQALAAVSDRSLVVVHGVGPRSLSRIDVTDADLADGAAGTEERHQEEPR